LSTMWQHAPRPVMNIHKATEDIMKDTDKTKLQTAFDCLRLSSGDVTAAKAYAAGLRVRISARTWYKAIEAHRLVSPVPVLGRTA